VVVRLRLIGQMEAWTLSGESVLPVGRKTRALLAVLALSAPRPVLRGRLAELLWSRRPEEQARASLRQEIHRLLETLGAIGPQALMVTRDHLAVQTGAAWVDVEEVLRATPAKPAALSLLDGELLEDLDGVDAAFDAWLLAERERLRDGARTVAETLLRQQTDPNETIAAAQQLLAIDRAHEGAWRALMRSHAARGERGMAIQAYERCRMVLAEQLDAQPSEETNRLLAELRAIGMSSRASPSVTESTADPRPHAGADAGGGPPAESVREPRAGRVAGPHVGVLPLQLFGTTEAEVPLATGLAEEITAALARFRWIFLVSSSALARFAGQTRDETAIRRAFDVHFLLDGTIQRVQGRLRIAMRLLDLRAGNQMVWSHRFDRQADDLLALQDEIAAEAVAQIDAEIQLIEARRALSRPLAGASSYHLMLRALALIDRLEQPMFAEAGGLLRQAIEQEPDHAAAHAWYAWWHVLQVGQDWADDPDAASVQAARHAERALVLDPQDAKALAIAGHVRAYLDHRLHEAISLHERALALNPNLVMAWGFSAVAFAYLGDLDEAERRLRRYRALSPLDPHLFFFDTVRCMVALLRGDFAAAVAIGRGVSEGNPNFAAARKPYLAALGHLGLLDEITAVRRRLLMLEPRFSVRGFLRRSPFEKPEHRDLYAAGLRAAGVPEQEPAA
ncbi:MAG TPA: BTAD domain-containing putative transcriptional regulator, partial [Acetobacteraceae bacterium]|nr:BTAD domain-containing putative transcriptional regulator [Acetobacteraceae bacterium]